MIGIIIGVAGIRDGQHRAGAAQRAAADPELGRTADGRAGGDDAPACAGLGGVYPRGRRAGGSSGMPRRAEVTYFRARWGGESATRNGRRLRACAAVFRVRDWRLGRAPGSSATRRPPSASRYSATRLPRMMVGRARPDRTIVQIRRSVRVAGLDRRADALGAGPGRRHPYPFRPPSRVIARDPRGVVDQSRSAPAEGVSRGMST